MTKINRKSVGATTYIFMLRDGWNYLTMVLHSKKIVGYSYGRSMTTELIIKALENACETQRPDKDLIFHSDLGTQYISDVLAQFIKSHDITHSFSHKGSPYDNACIESFYAILKKVGLILMHTFTWGGGRGRLSAL